MHFVNPITDQLLSIAGAQEKTALLYWQEGRHKPHGMTATTNILKPSIGRLPNGQICCQRQERLPSTV
jgi:serine/threonine-protein kinase HipA